MSIRDVILQAANSSKTFEPNLKVMRCVTAAIDYADSAASYRRPGYTWVKEWGQARVFEVFNPTGKNNIEMPVLVQNIPKAPFMKAISGIDWETLAGNLLSDIGTGGGAGGSPSGDHGLTHEWFNGYQGIDAFRVYMRQIASMQAFVYDGLVLQILPGTYIYNGIEAAYPGGFYDLTSKLPAAGNCVRVTVYYDPATVTVTSVSSAELPIGGSPSFTYPPANTLPIVWALLEDGDLGTTLEESRLYDARALWYMDEARFDDTEGDPVDVDVTAAADGTSTHTARRDHRHHGHDPITLDADAANIFDLSAQEIGLDTQAVNKVFAGPVTGAANEPTFRDLVAADIGTGAPDGTKFLRDDRTWTTPAGAGDVTGPAGAVDGNLAVFDTATGKLLKDGGAPGGIVPAVKVYMRNSFR